MSYEQICFLLFPICVLSDAGSEQLLVLFDCKIYPTCTSVSGGQLKYGDQFFFRDSEVKKKYAHAKMAVGGKFLGATSATSAS